MVTMDITVALPSGQNASFSVVADATVGWLMCAAQPRLKAQGLLRLVTKEGQMLAPQRRLWEEGLKDGDAKFIYEKFCLLLLKCGMICFSKMANCLCCIYNCIIICVWETKGFWTLILQWRIISTATQNSMGFPSTI